jgi:hypothetical protein
LSLIGDGVAPDNTPAAHEVEFFRVSGRAAAELELAAKCLHRRNTERLERHRNEARNDLLEDLAALQTRAAGRLALVPAAHPIQQAMPNMIMAARELFHLFDDVAAAASLAETGRGISTPAITSGANQCNIITQPIRE